MQVSGEIHAPATLPLSNKPSTHLNAGCIGHRAGPDVLGKKKSLVIGCNSNPGPPRPQPGRYKDYTTLALMSTWSNVKQCS